MHHTPRHITAVAVITVILAAAIACGSPDATPTEPITTVGVTVTDAAIDDTAAAVSHAVPSVPHRGYNVIGADDAPIVLYDYSDFV